PWATSASAVMVLIEASANPLLPISRSAASRIFCLVCSPRRVLGGGKAVMVSLVIIRLALPRNRYEVARCRLTTSELSPNMTPDSSINQGGRNERATDRGPLGCRWGDRDNPLCGWPGFRAGNPRMPDHRPHRSARGLRAPDRGRLHDGARVP